MLVELGTFQIDSFGTVDNNTNAIITFIYALNSFTPSLPTNSRTHSDFTAEIEIHAEPCEGVHSNGSYSWDSVSDTISIINDQDSYIIHKWYIMNFMHITIDLNMCL